MDWRFWRKKQRSDAPATATVTAVLSSEVAPDALSTSGFSFTVAPPPLPPTATAMEDVVRAKAAARRGASRAVRDRGVRPLRLPSLLPVALEIRARAEAAVTAPEAAQAWSEYVVLCPRDVDAWFALGQSLVEVQQCDAAWDAFSEARKRQPEHRLTLGALGYLSGRKRDHEGAVELFAQAVELKPDCIDMLQAMAHSLTAAGRASEAQATHDRIREIHDRGAR